MFIRFLGGCREVGSNAILIDNNILLDYGVKILPENVIFPKECKPRAVILSHAHLDHCGAIPTLFKKHVPEVYMTEVSLDLSLLLLKDALKVAKLRRYPRKYNHKNINQMSRATISISYFETIKLRNYKFMLYDAGHIPGSSGIYLETKNGENLFYTGDINNIDTHLLQKCVLPEKVDTLILECTYSQKIHRSRIEEEKRLIQLIEHVVQKNEKVIIPVFAVGRAQEILLILEKYTDMIALDGMAKKATEIILSNESFVKNSKLLKNIYDEIFLVRNRGDRNYVLKKFPIIIATAGMLSGGPVLFYIKKLRKIRETNIAFVGYQVDETPGKILLDTGVLVTENQHYRVYSKLHRFDLSSHIGRDGLFKLIEILEPRNVICVHGDECDIFAEELKEKYDIFAIAPHNGEVVKIDQN